MTDQERLAQLFAAGVSAVFIPTFEETEALELVKAAALEEQLPVWEWSVNDGLREGMLGGAPAIPDTGHPAAGLYHLSQQSGRFVAVMLDLAGHLKDERTLRALRETMGHFEKSGGHLVLVDRESELPAVVEARATRFEMSLPNEKEIDHAVRAALRVRNERRRVQLDIGAADMKLVVKLLRGLNRRQIRQVVFEACADDQRFSSDDLPRIICAKRRMLQGGGLLDFIETPVTLDEVGGLRRLKYWLEHRRNALGEKAAEFGLRAPRGMLMLGVQGAGKSLSAKAVATAWQWPLYRMDVGALYDRYIGESERRLRESLRQAERMSPMVLWIDEIEKGFASAASHSNDGGLSRRMFASILTWMQEHKAPVFIVATANDIEALPPELLRKGRFDEIFFVDLPEKDVREQIFAIHLRKRGRDPANFDLPALAEAAEGFSGAEIEQSVLAGLHDAFAAGEELNTARLMQAVKSSPPLAVTMAEKITALRGWAKGRCVTAD